MIVFVVWNRELQKEKGVVYVESVTELEDALKHASATQPIEITASVLNLKRTLKVEGPGVEIRSKGTTVHCPESGESALEILQWGVQIQGLKFRGCRESAVKIFTEGDYAIVFDSVEFENNTLDGPFAGGAAVNILGCADRKCAEKEPPYPPSVRMTNCTFRENFAGVGGAIYAENVFMHIEDCHFEQNTAKLCGAAVQIEGFQSTLLIEQSKFLQNHVIQDGLDEEVSLQTGLPLEPFRYLRFQFPIASGGALFIRSIRSVHILKSLFKQNSAQSGGAVVFKMEWTLTEHQVRPTVEIEKSHFLQNHAGGISQKRNRSAFKNLGGAIYLVSSVDELEFKIRDSLFERNFAGSGGALHLITLLTTSPKISKSTFLHNHASFFGGAILLRNTRLEIRDSVIQHNQAQIGGGLMVTNNAMLLAIGLAGLPPDNRQGNRSLFSSNFATRGGGMACVGSGDVILQDARIMNNTAVIGGGVFVYDTSSSVSFMQTTFAKNRAEVGGAASVEAAANVRFGSAEASLINTFYENIAERGSALHYVASHLKENRLTVYQAIVEDNIAVSSSKVFGRGGTLDLVLDNIPPFAIADILFENVQIRKNSASFGGGVSVLVSGEWNTEDVESCPSSFLSTDPCRRLNFVSIAVEDNVAENAPGVYTTNGKAIQFSCDVSKFSEAISLEELVQLPKSDHLDYCASFDNNFITTSNEEENITIEKSVF